MEALHAVLYQKSTDIRVIVAIDDDGKPGFSRAKVFVVILASAIKNMITVSVLKETVSADQSSVSNTVLEKQQQQDKMRVRVAFNCLVSRI